MRWLLLLLLIAACDSPSLQFRNAPATRVSVDGSVFSVRVIGERAEAMQISPELLPRTGTIFVRSEQAIIRASGCAVSRIDGDAAIQRATLDCPDQPGEPAALDPALVIIVVE